MTEIRFYHNAPDKLLVACQLAAKIYAQKRHALVFASEPGVAQRFDHMLWSFNQLAFVPHVMAQHALAAATPIVVAQKIEDLPYDDVLINLDGELPPNFARFETLIEIVAHTDEDRQRARQRWTFYKERGYALKAHDLAAT